MTILDTIVEQKRLEIARLPVDTPTVEQLRNTLRKRGGARDFARALRHPAAGNIALIAEVKKASPSAGVIRPDFDPVAIARTYEEGGASCLSVLTDEKFFQGSLTYLRDIRAAVSLPLLRKDFIIDARQIMEAIEWGADAILLIVAILDDQRLKSFLKLAWEAGIASLVEVHDEQELDRAVAAGASILGVNNRDLKTFKVNLGTTEELARRFKERHGQQAFDQCTFVAESGIHSGEDAKRLNAAGASAILVGESLMRQSDIRSKMTELLQIRS